MIDFVDTPQLLGIALRDAMATMHFHIAQTNLFLKEQFFLHLGFPWEQCGTNEILPWVGAK